MTAALTVAANNAHVWVNCQASPRMSREHPDLEPDSPKRVEGREWHTVAEHMVRTGELTGTEDQQYGAELWASTLAFFAPLESWHVEDRLALSELSPHFKDGQADAWTFGADGWLRVADYKAGHSYVSEFDHWQCLLYLAYLLRKLQADGTIADTPEAEEHLRISVTIVQPRYYGRHGTTRTWRGRASDLRTALNILQTAAALAASDKALAKVGPWCAKCDGRRGCATLQEAGCGIAEWAGTPASTPQTPLAVGVELQHVQAAMALLKARADGLEAQALHFLERSVGVPGFEMSAVQTRDTYRPGAEQEVIVLGEMLGMDLAAPRTALPPGKLKKLLDESVIKQYIHRPAGARKLMPVHPDTTKRIFSNGE